MNNQASGTVPYTAPAEMQIERQGAGATPMSRRFPQVRGGQCEFCGTVDANYPGDYQYKLCPHYRNMELKCSYCPDHKSQEEVVRNSTLNVAEHPYQRGVMIAWCGSFECSQKHIERFKISN